MRFSLLPTMIIDHVTQLTPAFLAEKDIRLLMLDFDNTIVPYTTNEPTAQMKDWLKVMIDADISVCVVSNSHNDRVKIFCEKYGLDCITHAKKPASKGIDRCIRRYGLDRKSCALAGDQIFTDTLGGNLAGVRTILVKPINNHNFWLKARHVLEKPFILLASNRRLSI